MSKYSSVTMTLPVNSAILSEDEMMLVEGGSWKKEALKFLIECVASWVAQSGLDYVWKNRTKYWNKFVAAASKQYKKTPELFAPMYMDFTNALKI